MEANKSRVVVSKKPECGDEWPTSKTSLREAKFNEWKPRVKRSGTRGGGHLSLL